MILTKLTTDVVKKKAIKSKALWVNEKHWVEEHWNFGGSQWNLVSWCAWDKLNNH